jgi:Glycoside hydrolase family 44/Bacterial Ig-like domain (group 3)
MRTLSVKATLLGLVILSLTAPLPRACGQTTGAPTLSVDAAASRNSISPDIYGIASYGLDATFAQEIQVANIRWGGDGTSRYNWEVDSSNSGYDWYFMGGSGAATAPTPGASPDLMVNTYKPAHAKSLITIPILPYVNKSYAWTCSFPVSEYGAQTSTNPYVFPVINGVTETCGNSIATVATNGSTQLVDQNILANHIANTTALQKAWVQHLVSTFGTGAAGGVKYYQLDNEPLGWSNTHRDVQPNTASYATIVHLGQAYAAAVKQADGSALILGPSDFTLGGWVGTSSQQGGLWAGQYYLQQMAAYEQTNHLRLLDYFDEHYYFDTSSPAAQLSSTRTLWDASYNGGTWVEQYDFNGPMQLIPRFKNWINTYYPGTKLSLSEYSIDSGQKSIVDAIAEMDVLGIFGREQLDFANLWSPPAPTDPIAYSFRMFRNYDGSGHQFGDTSISAVSSNQGLLSVYAAQRTSDNAITILAINKTTTPITSAIALANVSLPPAAEVYVYSAANLTSIVHSSNAAITAGTLTYTFPSYSAVMFVLQPTLLMTTTTITASATQLTAASTVTFKVTVTASGGGTPSGSISLMDGSTPLGTSSLTNGVASFPVSSLAAGSHTITAAYAGNLMDAASTSSVVVQVSGAPPPSPPSPTPPGAAGDYTLSLSNHALTVTAAQSAELMVTVTPQNGFSGSLSFACSGLPAGWICSFAPPTISGDTAQSTSLTVHATGSSLNASPSSGTLLAIVSPWPLLLIGFGSNKRRLGQVLWLVLATTMLASCGGGGSNAPVTSTGTWTVTVTASGDSAPTHTQSFDLSIDDD